MRYLTGKEAATKMGLTVRRIQQMCKNGELPGAVKEGRSWMIPDDSLSSSEYYVTVPAEKRKPLPIGVSDFKLATTEYYYIDKTLMIRDFLDNRPLVSLFTRPRRFGKTLNMDMFRVFFEKSSEDTSVYFKDKQIWQCGEEYTKYQGKYPVIFLSFKDVKCASWNETLGQITTLIAMECQRHMEMKQSKNLNDYEKELFARLMDGSAGEMEYQMSLRTLSLMMGKHYGEKTVIIIDEYDTPIQQGHVCGYYADVINFMRGFFSGGLKDNPHLAFGLMTGILRVAKESVFSGLNNLKINSVLDRTYSQYFGFTKEDVRKMLAYYDAMDKYSEVCQWYDGYMFGDTEIFNPWSVINYVDDDCFPKAFWQSTGSNDIVSEVIAAATPEITEDLYKMLSGQTVTTYVDTGVIYPEVQDNPYSIYSFLLVAGYLKVAAVYPQHDGNYMCEVGIPNKEIAYVYEKEILNRYNQNSAAISISQAIFMGDTDRMQTFLDKFMLETISSFDGVSENFYHGMMLGLCAVLGDRYKVRSNRESGLGRFDVMLQPQKKSLPGFIYEFKFTKNETDDLDALAAEALAQINDKKYETELLASGIDDVIKIGIAFRGKTAVVKR